MGAPKATYIRDILEEHYEELQFLWGQRERALRSPLYTMRELSMLEERIEAHTQGLLVVGDHVAPLVEEGLAGDDPLAAFAAGYALLRLGNAAATARALNAFASATGKGLDGLRQALCQAPLDGLRVQIAELCQTGPTPVAAAAAAVLTFHGNFRPTIEQIRGFVRDPDPNTRQTGWRLASYGGVTVDPKTYAAGLRDDDPAVKRAAVTAAVWNRVPGVVALGRQLAQAPSADGLEVLELLAVLGTAEDVSVMGTLGRAKEMGPARFRLVGAFGHPALMDLVLRSLADADPATAAAAGDAFSKMTGHKVDSGARVKVPPADGSEPDEFEQEFQDEVTLPDPALARAHWDKVKASLAQSSRICRGFDVSREASPTAVAALDMESRWETRLRGKFYGSWSGSPRDLEVFPQRG